MIRIALRLCRNPNIFIYRSGSTSTDKEFFLGLAKHTIQNRDERKLLNYDEFIDRINQEQFESQDLNNDEDKFMEEMNHEIISDGQKKSILRNENFTSVKECVTNDIHNKYEKESMQDSETFTNNIEEISDNKKKLNSTDFSFKDFVKKKTTISSDDILSPIKIKNKLSFRSTENNNKTNMDTKIIQLNVPKNKEKEIDQDLSINNNDSIVFENDHTSELSKATLTNCLNKETVKNLINFGVDLYRDENDRLRKVLLNLDWSKDISPILSFLKTNANLNDKEISEILSRDCRFFKRTLQQMEDTLAVLTSRGISPTDAGNIVKTKPGILCVDSESLRNNLMELEKAVQLTTNEVNTIILTHPKITVMRWTLLKNLSNHLRNNIGFSEEEIRNFVMKEPKILIKEKQVISENHKFLHRILELSYREIMDCTDALIVKPSILSHRVGFLKSLQLYQCDPTKESFTAISKIIDGSDEEFCGKIAKKSLREFKYYVRTRNERK